MGLRLSWVASSPDLLMIGRVTLKGHVASPTLVGRGWPHTAQCLPAQRLPGQVWPGRWAGGSGAGPGQDPPLPVSAAPPTSPAHGSAETATLGCEQPERMLFCVFRGFLVQWERL